MDQGYSLWAKPGRPTNPPQALTWRGYFLLPVPDLAGDGGNEGFDLSGNVAGTGANTAGLQIEDVRQAMRPPVALSTNPRGREIQVQGNVFIIIERVRSVIISLLYLASLSV